MNVIGLMGRKRSGKDTVCVLLAECASAPVIRLAFADELKREVAQACGVKIDFIETHKENFRLLLQAWGTEFRRGLYGDSYWVHRMERAIHRVSAASANRNTIVCLTDVRFPNEAGLVRKFGGKLIRIHRPTNDRTDSHASETAMDEWPADLTIENDADLPSLRRVVMALNQRLHNGN